MSWVKDNFLGGASKDAARRNEKQINIGKGELEGAFSSAKAGLEKAFPEARETQQQAYADVINLLQGTMPQVLGMGQQGNVNAQNTLLAGLPQYQNAILGQPVDYSGFQPTQLDVDYGFLENAQTPWMAQQQAQQQPADTQAIAGGQNYNIPMTRPQGGIFRGQVMGNYQGDLPYRNLLTGMNRQPVSPISGDFNSLFRGRV